MIKFLLQNLTLTRSAKLFIVVSKFQHKNKCTALSIVFCFLVLELEEAKREIAALNVSVFILQEEKDKQAEGKQFKKLRCCVVL